MDQGKKVWAPDLKEGFIQGEIQSAAYKYQREVEAGERIIVGVNRFQSAERGSVPSFRINPEIQEAQIAAVREVRADRDGGAWERAMRDLDAAARGTENLMPRIVLAAEAMATVGEISDCLRGVFGEYREGS